jgi:hypothetical protein
MNLGGLLHPEYTEDNDKLQKAVVAFCDGKKNGMIVWSQGRAIQSDIDDLGPLTVDIELGTRDKDAPDHGIWVWEGYFKFRYINTPDVQEWDCNVVTERWRAPTDEEWEAMKEQRNPFGEEESGTDLEV